MLKTIRAIRDFVVEALAAAIDDLHTTSYRVCVFVVRTTIFRGRAFTFLYDIHCIYLNTMYIAIRVYQVSFKQLRYLNQGPFYSSHTHTPRRLYIYFRCHV